MSLAAVLHPDGVLVTGVEDEPDGLRVYIGGRWTGLHTHVSDPDTITQVRAAWATGQHVTTVVPREARCTCEVAS